MRKITKNNQFIDCFNDLRDKNVRALTRDFILEFSLKISLIFS